VSHLAEPAAESIGADALLVRVGAIYHDCGKSANPQFYVENQPAGQVDSHDDQDPLEVAREIIEHVHAGVRMARKHRLPPRIQDFILEHHGTLLARYQYTRAVEAADNDPSQVDADKFRYPGPSPRSRETALLMLADGVEARARVELPKGEEELRALVKRVYDFYQKEGQLDHTSLTMNDLSLAADSFVNTLRGTYHPRIKYPELKTTPIKPQPPEETVGEHQQTSSAG
jgi:putative nucleotidyltransferase with HDIG domain